MTVIEKSKTQMRRGILEFCVLSIISRGEVYPPEIQKVLEASKIIVKEGTLYPMLTRLKNAGFLSYRWEESAFGPPRKYYSLTTTGKTFLNELKKTWENLVYAVNHTITIPPNGQETDSKTTKSK